MSWLKQAKKLCDTAFFRAVGLCPPPEAPSEAPPRQESAEKPASQTQGAGGPIPSTPASSPKANAGVTATPRQAGPNAATIPLGRRVEGGGLGATLDLPHHIQLLFTGTNVTNTLGLTEGNFRVLGAGVSSNGVFLGRPLFGADYQFSAVMRQPAEVSEAEKLAYVENIIELLELSPIADAIIGKPGEAGLGVEERKRDEARDSPLLLGRRDFGGAH